MPLANFSKLPKKLNLNPVSVKNQNRITNSVDPDETAHYELSHQDLQCLQKMVLLCRTERVTATAVSGLDKIQVGLFVWFCLC